MLPTISLEPEVTHYLNDNYANSAVLNKTQYSAWVKVQMPIYQGGAMTASATPPSKVWRRRMRRSKPPSWTPARS
ncbi:putative outer membrane efflux protein [Klebsiella michiganensis]|uniref:Putative outer membrane efflux protein n=1 Tax=Klebsiella michiganensis TaxID=1134687 RepID=A0A7H4LVX1_9ENTR|nr:putative outer membrane efflux protein [Klebsiella michiganensis]